jgi:hypothetical protein
VAGSIAPTNAGRAGRIGAPVILGRPATEDDPALPSGPMDEGTPVSRNVVESTVVGLAERGVGSSVVRIPPIVHSSTGRLQMIGLAKQKGSVGYPGEGKNAPHQAAGREPRCLCQAPLQEPFPYCP